MQTFILTCLDVEPGWRPGRRIAASTFVDWRIERKGWPMFDHTPHIKHIKPGDRCLVYLSSKVEKRRGFVGMFNVEEIEQWKFRNGDFDPPEACNPLPALVLKFSALEMFRNPRPIEYFVDKLKFFSGNDLPLKISSR